MGDREFTAEDLDWDQRLVPRGAGVSADAVCQAVAARYGILHAEALKGKDRHATVAHARHVAMYLCRKYLAMSYPELGRHFGGRDHTTAIAAVRKVEAQAQADGRVREVLRAVERELGVGE